jgi:peptide/nickel transport system ATP-binding protein
MAMLVVTHDLAFVTRVADRIAVMHAGRIVEEGPTATICGRPRHEHTRALIAAATHAAPGTGPS